MLVMFTHILNRCRYAFSALYIFFVTTVPVWAAEAEEKEPEPVWVIAFAVMILFLSLVIALLLRPTKRDDSAFSFDELKALKEEEMKKLKGTTH